VVSVRRIIALLLTVCFTISLSGCTFDPLAMFNLNGKSVYQKANKEKKEKAKDNKTKDNNKKQGKEIKN
jgi:hypothetical protein